MSHVKDGHISKPNQEKRRSYKNQTRKYNAKWERMPEFTDWLSKSPFGTDKAWCVLCERELRTHMGDLKAHAGTTKHRRLEVEHGIYTNREEVYEDYDNDEMLMESGADPEILNHSGQSPSDVAIDGDVKEYLDPSQTNIQIKSEIIAPEEKGIVHIQFPSQEIERKVPKAPKLVQKPTKIEKYKILKIRLGQVTDPDFIEIDLPETQWTYQDLMSVMLNELCLEEQPESHTIERIRKLPNTRLRRDIEVQRLVDYTELELILE